MPRQGKTDWGLMRKVPVGWAGYFLPLSEAPAVLGWALVLLEAEPLQTVYALQVAREIPKAG